jgi:hypothetical protein
MANSLALKDIGAFAEPEEGIIARQARLSETFGRDEGRKEVCT